MHNLPIEDNLFDSANLARIGNIVIEFEKLLSLKYPELSARILNEIGRYHAIDILLLENQNKVDKIRLSDEIDRLTMKVIRYQEALMQLRDMPFICDLHDVRKVVEEALRKNAHTP